MTTTIMRWTEAELVSLSNLTYLMFVMRRTCCKCEGRGFERLVEGVQRYGVEERRDARYVGNEVRVGSGSSVRQKRCISIVVGLSSC